jgi:hypothetical protein
VTTTLPVIVPDGTFTVILEALQLAAVPAGTPLNVTVLVPWEVPKFDPAIVTGAPACPLFGVINEMLGGSVPLAALSAASSAPPLSDVDSVALTETAPGAPWTASSAISFEFGAAGTRSSMT